jgi:dipeptidyl aminopeptidase/acylaminoacyl peptidase
MIATGEYHARLSALGEQGGRAGLDARGRAARLRASSGPRPGLISREPVKSFRTLCLAAASAAILAASAPSVVLAQTPARAAALPSPADFGRFPAFSSVQISPDGRHVAALTSPDGMTQTISVWRTDDLAAPPNVLSSARQRINGFGWLKSDRLYVQAIQNFDAPSSDAGEGYRGHLTKSYVVTIDGAKWTPLLPDERGRTDIDDFVNRVTEAALLDTLPQDPDHVLAIRGGLRGAGDVFKVNVRTGSTTRVARGSDKYGDLMTDLRGEIRARSAIEYDSKGPYVSTEIRDPQTGAWQEHFRIYAKTREGMSLVGFTTDPNIVYVSARKNGRDRGGIYTYDLRTRQIVEPAFEHKLFEALNVVESRDSKDYGRVLGFSYYGETPRTYWLDETLAAIDKGLNQTLQVKTTPVEWTDPATGQKSRFSMSEGARAEITDWSDDRRKVIVVKSGPQQPPEYYLLTDGSKLQLLGRARPQIDKSLLGQSRMIQYEARDGLMIPAFLHTPSKSLYGAGPYPAIVLPHGGPWARDDYDYDFTGWVPFLVSRGYAVLQPQFRGSEGWGEKLWRAGDGQWGLTMQDDKDDGAKWLISQGIADPQRIAMFGYSYGGYAAIAASVRSNGLYQCAISGAGLPGLKVIRVEANESRFQREYQRPALDGVNWTPRARDANIPILIYYPDRDDNVEPREPRSYANALRAAGKPYKEVAIRDMGHSVNTWTAEHSIQQLQLVADYLKRDCGPGGL